MLEIHPGDNLIEWCDAANSADGTYLDSDADVSFSLYTDSSNSPGTVVDGAEDVAMSYVADSNGKFQGVLESAITATLTVGNHYWIKATAVYGTLVGIREWRVVFTRRGPTP